MSVTQEIKSRLDIVDIVSEQVPLRRSGRNYSPAFALSTPTRVHPHFMCFQRPRPGIALANVLKAGIFLAM